YGDNSGGLPHQKCFVTLVTHSELQSFGKNERYREPSNVRQSIYFERWLSSLMNSSDKDSRYWLPGLLMEFATESLK
ncbi:MAG TPA: hypothetical protein VHQ01_05940, partial [Pyrinomonadaceae bacterium]|nr:hypothetical protein [Pyrinomonadaceae bacterium]